MVTEVESIHAIEKRNEEKLKKQSQLEITRYEDRTIREKYLYNGIKKKAVLDIESSGLTADFDITLSYALLITDIKTNKKTIKSGLITKEDIEYAIKKRDADLIDKRLLEQLLEDIKGIDLLIGHWFIGKHRHDIPFIRSRCAINGLLDKFPRHKTIRYGDTQKWGSQLFRLHSFGLSSLADSFNIIQQKSPVKPKDWKLACLGDKKALKYVLKHNIIDVKITDKVLTHIEPLVPIAATYA
jgi:uncharacterized protein YprB with RNaseH-like and TPR domain